MDDVYWLRDDARAAIEPHLPKNRPGQKRVDDRRVIGGILHVCSVPTSPARFGFQMTAPDRALA